VLVKLMNRSGYDLGSAVVSLTHLLHTSTDEVRATVFPSVSSTFYWWLLLFIVYCNFVGFWVCSGGGLY
jgi:hypothetical protein